MNSGIADHKQLADDAVRLKEIDRQLDQKSERWLELAEFME
jgi:hypothetical protein